MPIYFNFIPIYGILWISQALNKIPVFYILPVTYTYIDKARYNYYTNETECLIIPYSLLQGNDLLLKA